VVSIVLLLRLEKNFNAVTGGTNSPEVPPLARGVGKINAKND
jgi:hypothetical protein